MTPEAILRELLASESVSGAALAARFGVTRAAVWKQIERLRALGVEIEALAGRGYRLVEPVELLDAESLRRDASPAARALLREIAVHFELDSTSSELLRRRDGAHGVVVFAEHQSAGRGRRGRLWHSPLAANICVSFGWRYDAGVAALSGLSLAIGVALARALESEGIGGVALKWPNDVYANGRKLAGILIEMGGELGGPCDVVVGIGLNWRMRDGAARDVDQPWIDLARLAPGALPARHRIAVALLDQVLPALADFGRAGLAPFLSDWRRLDALAGKEIDIVSNAQLTTATALGIDLRGLLRVRVDGRERRLASGEVSVRQR